MSGPYMQYAHARTYGILRKVPDLKIAQIKLDNTIKFTEEKERSLAFML